MIPRTKRIAIFFREMPAVIERAVAADDTMKLFKDGIFTTNGIRCPRATLALEWNSSKADLEKLKKLIALLEELQANNQIVTFSIRT